METLTSYLSEGERSSDSDDEVIGVFEVEDDYCEPTPRYSAGATTYFAEDLAYVAQYAINPPVEFQAPVIKVSDAPLASINNNTTENDDSSDDDDDSEVAEDTDVASQSQESSDSEPDILLSSSTKNIRKKAVRWLTEEEDEDMPDGPIRTKNEVVDIVETETLSSQPPIATTDLKPIGEVLYRIDHEKTAVIQADHTIHPLNEGSVICSETGVVVGNVHEVFGPITRPFYIVRYNKSTSSSTSNNVETAIPAIFTVGVKVFTAAEHSTFITPQMLGNLRSKGSDASNVYDEEPAVEEIEYSDDEEEMMAKQARKRQSKRATGGTEGTGNLESVNSGKRKIIMHGSQGGNNANNVQQQVIHVPIHMFQQQQQSALQPAPSSSQQTYACLPPQQQQQPFYQPPPFTAAWPQQPTIMPYPAWQPAGVYPPPQSTGMGINVAQQLPQYQYKPLGQYQQQQPILQPPPPPGPHPSLPKGDRGSNN